MIVFFVFQVFCETFFPQDITDCFWESHNIQEIKRVTLQIVTGSDYKLPYWKRNSGVTISIRLPK